jgi:hypothetical protein
MQNDEYDVKVLMYDGEPVALGMTPKGHTFLADIQEWLNVEEFLAAIPPGLRVGALNPETNIFVLLPTSPLH